MSARPQSLTQTANVSKREPDRRRRERASADIASGVIFGDIWHLCALMNRSRRGTFEFLRQYPELAAQARRVLGPRSVRYDLRIVREFIEKLPTHVSPEPKQLREARALRLASKIYKDGRLVERSRQAKEAEANVE